jgi:hypothetical protein
VDVLYYYTALTAPLYIVPTELDILKVCATRGKFDLAERLNRTLTLPGNPGSNLILVNEIEIQFVFLDKATKLPQIQQCDSISLHVLAYEPLALSVSNECDRVAQIAGKGVGLVSIRNHPRDKNTRKRRQLL